jgi:hypothetical protein
MLTLLRAAYQLALLALTATYLAGLLAHAGALLADFWRRAEP